jgi:hypothetical protein
VLLKWSEIDDVQLKQLERQRRFGGSVPGIHVTEGETRRCEGKDYSREETYIVN